MYIKLAEKLADAMIIGIKLHATDGISSEKLFFSVIREEPVKYFLC